MGEKRVGLFAQTAGIKKCEKTGLQRRGVGEWEKQAGLLKNRVRFTFFFYWRTAPTHAG